jgi:hypothetical protein
LKIRIDQNLSPRAAAAIEAAVLSKSGYEVSYVGNEHPPGTSDPDWLKKFASEGGTAIVSGDFRILQNWVDLVAYTETGLISFFPQPAFEKLNRFGKIAFLVRWWPAIIEQIKISKLGDRWRMPMSWEPSPAKFELLRDPRVKGRSVEPAGKVLSIENKRKDGKK